MAVEMLSSVVLMNQAMDAGDRAALWRLLSSPVAGLSNVEESYAQRSEVGGRRTVQRVDAAPPPLAGTWTS